MDISGNTVFLPGASSGIGLALALELHRKGNEVIIGGRRTEVLERLTAEHPGLHAVTVDVEDPASLRAAADRVVAEHPDLNVLIAMAGIMRVEDWTHAEGFLRDAEQVVTTNVLGTIRLIAAFLEQLRSRPAATIMTVSSGLAFTPLGATPSYNASKAAIHMLSESLRLQWEGTGVEVLELQPPGVATDLLPGHRDNPVTMPLEEFVAEVIALLEAQPHGPEIQVERVKALRYSEVRGEYAQTVAALNGSDAHGS